MSSNYDAQNISTLRNILRDRGIITKTWMLNYVRKSEAIYLLSFDDTLDHTLTVPENFRLILKHRRKESVKKYNQNRAYRQRSFSIDNPTKEEVLRHLAMTKADMKFLRHETHPEGFDSVTGHTRASLALVFTDGISEFMVSKAEAKKLESFGISIPPRAYSPIKKKNNSDFKQLFNG